jgi:hypothetical protein
MFMASGMVAATLAHTAAALGIAPTAAGLAWPTAEVANSGALLAATALLTFLGLAKAGQSVSVTMAGMQCVMQLPACD